MDRELLLPADFTEYAWEVEVKGVFWDASVRVDDTTVAVTFYDPVRLSQDVRQELASGGSIALKRVLVIPLVTEDNMRAAIASLAETFLIDT